MKLPEYANQLDNAINEDWCAKLMSFFELSDGQEKLDLDGFPTFTQLNLNQHAPQLKKPLVYMTMQVLERYKALYPASKYFPEEIYLEEFRIKRYNSKTSDRFDTHVDVADHASAKRYLAFLFYLNDTYAGGHTEFEFSGKVKPRAGSVLIFPPTWQFPHAGLPVKRGTKYIMSTYLCFA